MAESQDRGQPKWIEEAEEALNRTGEALRAAWEQTRDARISALAAAKEAANRLGEAIDQGIDVAKKTWDSESEPATGDRLEGPDATTSDEEETPAPE
jgi:hypothetical protein